MRSLRCAASTWAPTTIQASSGWFRLTTPSPRQLTFGSRDSAPAYSPDGKWLAFLRAEKDASGKPGKPQLWVMPTGGGEARRVTDNPIGVEALEWSGDSTRLAYLARVPEDGRYGTVEGRGPGKEPPRRITRYSFHRDGVGYLLDRPRHIFVVTVADENATPVQITKGELDHGDVRWNALGDLLTFVCAAHDNRNNDLRNDVFVSAPDGTGRRALTSGGMSLSQPCFGPDGQTVYFVGNTLGANDVNGVAMNDSLWSVPVTGAAAPTRLTDEETYHLSSTLFVGDDGILFPNENRGAVDLLLIPFDGGAPQVLLEGPRQVQAASMISTPSGPLVVASFADGQTWGDIVLREWDGEERVLTDFSAGYRAEAPAIPLEEVTATAADGYPVHGWLARPAGDGPHPVLLMIHGGPFTQYGWQLFDEAQVYAGAGYAVLYTNPRGSSGYGQAHGRAVIGNVGEVSTGDLTAILDAALKDPGLDADRVGVLGGSHGGYMTTWLAAHEGAAIQGRGVRACRQRHRQLYRLVRHRLLLRRRSLRDRSGAAAPAVAADLRGPDRHPDADRPLRGRLALPDRAGQAALRGAPQARQDRRDADLPVRRSRAQPCRTAIAPAGPVRRDPGLVRPLPVAAIASRARHTLCRARFIYHRLLTRRVVGKLRDNSGECSRFPDTTSIRRSPSLGRHPSRPSVLGSRSPAPSPRSA